MYVDVFQDSTGITNLTNVLRNDNEFVSSVSNDANTIYLNKFEANPPETDSSSNNIGISHRNSGMTRSSTSKFGSYSVAGNATTSTFMRTATNSAFSFGSGDFTIECWIRPDAVNVDTLQWYCNWYIWFNRTRICYICIISKCKTWCIYV